MICDVLDGSSRLAVATIDDMKPACSSTKRRPRCPAAVAVVHHSLPPSSDLDSLGNGLHLPALAEDGCR
jgi:hypothetical protein